MIIHNSHIYALPSIQGCSTDSVYVIAKNLSDALEQWTAVCRDYCHDDADASLEPEWVKRIDTDDDDVVVVTASEAGCAPSSRKTFGKMR